MDSLGEFAWVMPLAVFVGTVLAVYRGYYRARNGEPHATIHGSTIIDSKIGHELLVIAREQVTEARRIANAIEIIQERLVQDAKDHDMEIMLERKLSERERERRDRQTRGD